MREEVKEVKERKEGRKVCRSELRNERRKEGSQGRRCLETMYE
jgi:hypothetical protein